MSRNEFVWVEKYRPQTIDECYPSRQHQEDFQGLLGTG